jgi:hypothetical protein
VAQIGLIGHFERNRMAAPVPDRRRGHSLIGTMGMTALNPRYELQA